MATPKNLEPGYVPNVVFNHRIVVDESFVKLMSTMLPKDITDCLFGHWYTGHDPYNSADNPAFMDRLTKR